VRIGGRKYWTGLPGCGKTGTTSLIFRNSGKLGTGALLNVSRLQSGNGRVPFGIEILNKETLQAIKNFVASKLSIIQELLVCFLYVPYLFIPRFF